MDLSIAPALFSALAGDNSTVDSAPFLQRTAATVAVQSLIIAAFVAWVAIYVVPYFYVRRPSTGYIEGSESSHLLSGGANVPVIHALLILKGKLTPEGLKAALIKAGIPHERFQRLSQCVSSSPGVVRAFDPRQHWPPYFVTDPHFDLGHHVRWLPSSASVSGDASGAGGDDVDDGVVHNHATLSKHLSAIINTPPPLDRPPWEMLVVRHFDAAADKHAEDDASSTRSRGKGKKHAPSSHSQDIADGSALILRVHHVLSDGLALVAFMDAITEECGGVSEGSVKRSSLESAMRVGLKPQHTGPIKKGGRLRDTVAQAVHNITLAVRVMVELPVSMYKDYLTAPDEDNALKLHSGLSGKKRVAWDCGSAISLKRIKHVKDKLGVKLNDVLLACATAALRQALIDAHKDTKPIPHHKNSDSGEGSADSDGMVPTVRFFAPMSARATSSLSALPDLNNRLSVLSLPLPTGLTDPLARLFAIARLTESLKSSAVPLGLSLLWTPMGYMPKDWLQAQSDFLCHKCTGVLTNVPGPSHERSLAGQQVTDLMFWVPAVGSIGMVLSIITYAHALAVGLVVDETVPCDPDAFLRHFHAHFLHYERLAHANTDH